MMINDHHRKQMIIGTALGALNGLGSGNGLLSGLLGGGSAGSCSKNAGITNEELYIERSQAAEHLAVTHCQVLSAYPDDSVYARGDDVHVCVKTGCGCHVAVYQSLE